MPDIHLFIYEESIRGWNLAFVIEDNINVLTACLYGVVTFQEAADDGLGLELKLNCN